LKEGDLYILQGQIFFPNIYCKFGEQNADIFFLDNGNLFCKVPPSLNTGVVSVSLYYQNNLINQSNTIDYTYYDFIYDFKNGEENVIE